MDQWTPEQLKQHLDDGQRVFLKLFKRGCGICKLSEPATERLEHDNQHQLAFGKIDVEQYPEMLETSGTDVLPAFFVFADRSKKGQFIGFKGLNKLKDFVDGCFSAKD